MSHKTYRELTEADAPPIVSEVFDLFCSGDERILRAVIRFDGVRSELVSAMYISDNFLSDAVGADAIIESLKSNMHYEAIDAFVNYPPNRLNWPARPAGIKAAE